MLAHSIKSAQGEAPDNASSPPHPRKRSAVDEIVQNIRDYISAGGLSVGDRLPTEREFCEIYNSGRNTVREAMRILTAYGLVEVRPKVGATVADNRMTRVFDLFSLNSMDISLETFADVQEFRSLIEIGPIGILCENVTDQDIAELRAINAQMSRAAEITAASELDFQFHLRLVAVLRNKTIHDVYQVMKPVIVRIMEKGKTNRTFKTETFTEHEGVIDALEARDQLAFRYRLRNHLMASAGRFTTMAEKAPA